MKFIFQQVSTGGQASCVCGDGMTGDPQLGGAGCECATDACGANAQCQQSGPQIYCICDVQNGYAYPNGDPEAPGPDPRDCVLCFTGACHDTAICSESGGVKSCDCPTGGWNIPYPVHSSPKEVHMKTTLIF